MVTRDFELQVMKKLLNITKSVFNAVKNIVLLNIKNDKRENNKRMRF